MTTALGQLAALRTSRQQAVTAVTSAVPRDRSGLTLQHVLRVLRALGGHGALDTATHTMLRYADLKLCDLRVETGLKEFSAAEAELKKQLKKIADLPNMLT